MYFPIEFAYRLSLDLMYTVSQKKQNTQWRIFFWGGGGGGGGGRTPLGVLQKNSGSTNFEKSGDSRQHDYYYYQFLPCS